MKSKVIEAEVGKCGNWKTRDTDTDAIPASSLSLSLSELAAIRFGRASSVDSTETEFGTGGGRRKGKRKSRME